MRSELKIYSDKDFKNAKTRQERFYMTMLQPEQFYPLLTIRERTYFETLKKAWVLLDGHTTMAGAARAIADLGLGLTYASAMVVCKDAQELLGPLMKVNKDYERVVLVEKAKNVYEKCIDIEDYRSAAAALAVWMKTLRLDKMDDNDFKFDDLTIPPLELSTEAATLTDYTVVNKDEEE